MHPTMPRIACASLRDPPRPPVSVWRSWRWHLRGRLIPLPLGALGELLHSGSPRASTVTTCGAPAVLNRPLNERVRPFGVSFCDVSPAGPRGDITVGARREGGTSRRSGGGWRWVSGRRRELPPDVAA